MAMRTCPRVTYPNGIQKRLSRRRMVAVRAGPKTDANSTAGGSSAADCVARGLEAFAPPCDAELALRCFEDALQRNPSEDEARAAYYNKACALTRLRDFDGAAEALRVAVMDYRLRFDVALKDPDLKALRERKQFDALSATVRGGDGGQKLQARLRSELKSPFRTTRVFLLGALTTGALLALLVSTTFLVKALMAKGTIDASDSSLVDAEKNFAINVASALLLGGLLYRDLREGKRQEEVSEREERMGMLQVSLGRGKEIPLSRFRSKNRPVILAGNESYLKKATNAASTYQTQLMERGVFLVPVLLDGTSRTKSIGRRASGFGDASKFSGAEGASPSTSAPALGQASKWKVQPVDEDEWQSWLDEQLSLSGAVEGENVYVQVQLDGSVRASGSGIPPWKKFVDDLPMVQDVRSKFQG
mmetsp:Transcript_1772/g.6689  ORF Transcript_1772/g.6689 Transcript_1772/m.6689 type:complete len:418 (-) Transcript_1772:29-1282(-)